MSSKTFAILNPDANQTSPALQQLTPLTPPPPPPAATADASAAPLYMSLRVHETHSVQYQEKYKILHLIQMGGWGAVFAAEREDGSPVAMKFFGYCKNAPVHSYINNEILLMMALKGCSGAIQIQSIFYDRPQGFISTGPYKKLHGLTESYPVIVMERTSGMDLLDLISYNHKESLKPNSTIGKFTIQSLAVLFKNFMVAIQSIHEKGFIHRDLKLDNVLAVGKTLDSGIKIIDFGTMISISVDNEVNIHSMGAIVGTRELIAPETMARREYSFKSDVWQVGCCLYNMVFMRTLPTDFINMNITNPNFLFRKPAEVVDALLFPPSPEWDSAPESLKNLLRGMLTIDPNKRLSVQEVMEHEFTNLEVQSPNTQDRESKTLDHIYHSNLNRILFAQKLRNYFRDQSGKDSTNISQENPLDMARYFFDLFDLNKDEVISKEEMHEGVQKIYRDEEGITAHAIDALFASIDTDGDGSIDCGEFIEFFIASVSTTTVTNNIDSYGSATARGGGGKEKQGGAP